MPTTGLAATARPVRIAIGRNTTNAAGISSVNCDAYVWKVRERTEPMSTLPVMGATLTIGAAQWGK